MLEGRCPDGPRAGGEYHLCVAGQFVCCGGAPRLRGAHGRRCPKVAGHGRSPAVAGSTTAIKVLNRISWEEPRAGGEYSKGKSMLSHREHGCDC